MRKYALLIPLLLSGCATPPPEFSTEPETFKIIDASRVVVSDFTSDDDPGIYDTTWSNDYELIYGEYMKPPFNRLAYGRLSKRYTASGDVEKPVMDISIIRANLLQKSRIADTIPIVGIFSVLTERGFLCSVDANFRYDDLSIRKTFTSKQVLPLPWSDAKPSEKKNLVEECFGEITTEMDAFIQKLTAR